MRFGWTVALALCASAAGAADRDDAFSARGRVLVSGAFSLANVSSSATGSSSVTTLALTPEVQLFVAPKIAVGLQLELAHATGGGTPLTELNLLPSIGYCIELGEYGCFLPQFEMGLQVLAFGPTQTAFVVGGLAPLLFRPAPGFFVGFGPSVLADVTRSNSNIKLLTFALQSMLGGVF
jgi:hypothetical protein